MSSFIIAKIQRKLRKFSENSKFRFSRLGSYVQDPSLRSRFSPSGFRVSVPVSHLWDNLVSDLRYYLQAPTSQGPGLSTRWVQVWSLRSHQQARVSGPTFQIYQKVAMQVCFCKVAGENGKKLLPEILLSNQKRISSMDVFIIL